MPIIPLGIGAYKRTDGFVPEVTLRNLYLERDKSGISPDDTLRVQRPGLVRQRDFGAIVRGVHFFAARQQQVIVAGTTIYTDGMAAGTIAGTGKAIMASTAFAVIINADAKGYLFDGSLQEVPLPEDAPDNGYLQDVDQLNGYGLFLQRTGRFYWLEPGATTINDLNFSTAESLPDAAVAIARLGDEFWIFGQQNVEVWQSTGDADQPFARASGRNFERGCLHREAVCRFDNTLVWVGDDYQVYRASSVPQVISDAGITERVRRATGECTAWTFGVDGHSFYILSIPGQGRFAYDASTQQWSEWSWPADDGYQVDGGVMAIATDGRLFTVSPDVGTDDGVPFERVVTATVPISGKPGRNDSFSLGVGTSANTTIRLRWKDGQEEFPGAYEELLTQAPYDVVNLYRLGLPYAPLRTFEVSCVSPERVRFSGAMVNEAWR